MHVIPHNAPIKHIIAPSARIKQDHPGAMSSALKPGTSSLTFFDIPQSGQTYSKTSPDIPDSVLDLAPVRAISFGFLDFPSAGFRQFLSRPSSPLYKLLDPFFDVC
jgi:hypothetical protein